MTTEDIASGIPSKRGSSALQMGPRKKVLAAPCCHRFLSTHLVIQLLVRSACLPRTTFWPNGVCAMQLPFPTHQWHLKTRTDGKYSTRGLFRWVKNYFSFCSLIDTFGRERREHRVFEQLLDSYPGLLERLTNGSEEEILHIGELVHHSHHDQSSR